MPFQKGNQEAKKRGKDKAFADALRIAANETDEATGKRKLRLIAERLVTEAINGEGWAVQQVADRLDGKPAQESTVTIDDKRDATDWTRDELVAFLNDCRNGSNGTTETDRGPSESDIVH